MKQQFGVIGNPISHSMSPQIHQLFASQFQISLTYERILGDLNDFESQVSNFFKCGGKGLNVTLPFKERAFDLAKEHTSRCLQAGAANTLWIKDGVLHADNTDGIGFIHDVNQFHSLSGQNVLILGAGGASRGIIQPILDEKPNALMIWNRTEEKSQILVNEFPGLQSVSLDDLKTVDCIINATSASLSGFSIDLPKSIWDNKPFCYDLAYDLKKPTSFIAFAKERGCQALDGIGMLVGQAAEAFYIWHGLKPETDSVIESLLPEKLFNDRCGRDCVLISKIK